MSESLDTLVGKLRIVLDGHREHFVAWLQTRVADPLSVEGPENFVNGKYEEIYTIKCRGALLGKYTVEYALSEGSSRTIDGKAQVEPPHLRHAKIMYDGRVPEYVNPSIAGMNEYLAANEVHADVSQVRIIFAYLEDLPKPMQPSRHSWRRDDGLKDIPFP